MTGSESVAAAIARFAPVDLHQLNASAGLLTRVDRKYLLIGDDLAAAMDQLSPATEALEIAGVRGFGYQSVYFDTPYLSSYLLAARSRPRRFKVRTREYLDSGQQWLEVKTRDRRGRTVKARMPYDRADQLTREGLLFVAAELERGCPVAPEVVIDLAPELVTRYRRSTLLLPGEPGEQSRATLDTELIAEDTLGNRLRLPDLAIVETKSANGNSALDRLLWRLGHRPIKVSKFATTLAALHPVLPANKWLPALRRVAADAQFDRR
ncbi:MAG: polyphosphate polymerase domain-containing protein [Candidatus Nanopelagicales bacterium]